MVKWRRRKGISFPQRITLKLTRRRDGRRIQRIVSELSNGNSDYTDYLDSQINNTRLKQFTDKSDRIGIYAAIVEKYCVGMPDTPMVLSIGPRNHYELDILSGDGRNNVTGIDLWPADPRILCADMHNMPFLDNTFDLVFASHVFEHSYNFHKIAKEITRVLKPSGYVFSATPVKRDVNEFERLDFDNVENFLAQWPTEPEVVMRETAFVNTHEIRTVLRLND